MKCSFFSHSCKMLYLELIIPAFVCLYESTSPMWLASFRIYCYNWCTIVVQLWIAKKFIVLVLWHCLLSYILSLAFLKLMVKLYDGHVVKVEDSFCSCLNYKIKWRSSRTTCYVCHSSWIVFPLGGTLVSVKVLSSGIGMWTLRSGEVLFIILKNFRVLNKSQDSLPQFMVGYTYFLYSFSTTLK